MNTMQKRFLLYFVGCIGTRTLFMLIARNTSIHILQILGLLAIIPAIGFINIYLTGSRQTGREVFGGKIWWNNLRPIHSILYALFAYYAITKQRFAWKILKLDIIIGTISFLVYHTITGNIQKLF
jgi:hypothetical protein